MNRKFRKLTSNRHISDPLQREINYLCRHIDKQVSKSLRSGDLTIHMGTVRYQTPHMGVVDLFSDESKESFNNGDVVMKRLVNNFLKLHRKALTKYNHIISENEYTYSISDIQYQLIPYKMMDDEGDVVAFRFVCNFWCSIEFRSSTTDDILNNIDNTLII